MYALLIEAGGLSQLTKLEPEWSSQFISSTQTMLKEHQFSLISRDGPHLYCVQHSDAVLNVKMVITLLTHVQDFLASQEEYLLDYTMYLDYLQHTPKQNAALVLEQRTSSFRATRCVYLAPAVHAILGPHVESTVQGPIYRVVDLNATPSVTGTSYDTALTVPEVVQGAREILNHSQEKRGIWFWGNDRTTVATSVAHLLQEEDYSVVAIHCYAGMSMEDLLISILSSLPSRGESPPLQDRIGQRDLLYFSWNRRLPDLFALTRDAIAAFLQESPQNVVYFTNPDLCSAPIEGANSIPSLFPEARNSVSAIISAGTFPPSWSGWTGGQLRTAIQQYSGARRYWESRNPLVSKRQLEVLFAASRLEPIISQDNRDRILPRIGITPAEYARVVAELVEDGIVLSIRPFAINPALPTGDERFWKRVDQAEALQHISQGLIELSAEGFLHVTPRIWLQIGLSTTVDQAAPIVHQLLHFLADNGSPKDIEDLEESLQSYSDQRIQFARISARLRSHVRAALSQSAEALRTPSVERDVARLREWVYQETTPKGYAVECTLTLGEYYLAQKDYKTALSFGKHAMILNQEMLRDDVPYPKAITSEGASYLLMARITFLLRRFNETTQYLSFSMESSSRNYAIRHVAQTMQTLFHFVTGNLSRARTLLEDQQEQLLNHGFSHLSTAQQFVRARIDMLLGEYESAEEQFGALYRWAEKTQAHDAATVCAAWQCRAMLLGGQKIPEALACLQGLRHSAEAHFFLGEHYAKVGEFSKALEALAEAESIEGQRSVVPGIRLCWANGFALAEDLLLADTEENTQLRRLVRAIRGWVLAQIGEEPGMTEALTIFYDLTRGTATLPIDPHTALYNYLYSTILPATPSQGMDDRRTILGKAVKLMQERASRIDEYQDKIRFLQKDSWHRDIVQAGKGNNLI